MATTAKAATAKAATAKAATAKAATAKAATARAATAKEQIIYAPSRVYSYSRSSLAEKPEPEELENIPEQIPRVEPIAHPAPRTRVNRDALPAQKRKQRVLPKIVSIMGIAAIAAMLIGMIVRYSQIAGAYRAVNDTQKKISESQRRLTELQVQLDEAVSIEQARLAALEAGLNYPTAEQIVTVNGAIGEYLTTVAGSNSLTAID